MPALGLLGPDACTRDRQRTSGSASRKPGQRRRDSGSFPPGRPPEPHCGTPLLCSAYSGVGSTNQPWSPARRSSSSPYLSTSSNSARTRACNRCSACFSFQFMISLVVVGCAPCSDLEPRANPTPTISIAPTLTPPFAMSHLQDRFTKLPQGISTLQMPQPTTTLRSRKEQEACQQQRHTTFRRFRSDRSRIRRRAWIFAQENSRNVSFEPARPEGEWLA
jgi:hypothetical protein